MRARSGLIGRWEGPEVIRGSFLELKVAGPSMLGIRHPDRHALPRITLSKTHQPCRALPPARAGSFFGAQGSLNSRAAPRCRRRSRRTGEKRWGCTLLIRVGV